ncbi:MAG: hypothetical protein ACREE0_18795 [Phenylobacterium sp.]
MSEALAPGSDAAGGKIAQSGPVDWLSLAAAPTFAVMALLTAVPGGDALSMVCGPARGVLGLSGMVPMYLLMSAFHSAPWLKLIGARGARKFDRTPPT